MSGYMTEAQKVAAGIVLPIHYREAKKRMEAEKRYREWVSEARQRREQAEALRVERKAQRVKAREQWATLTPKFGGKLEKIAKLHSPEFDACGDKDFDPDYDWPCGTAEILLGTKRPREGE